MSMSDGMKAIEIDQEDIEDRAGIKRDILLGVIYRSAALALFAAFVVIYFPASDYFYPAIYAAVILYLGSIVSMFIAGKMSRPIVYAALVLAVTVFLALALPAQDMFPSLQGLQMPILITGIIGSAHCFSRAYSVFTGVVTRALLIAALGVLYYSAFTSVEMPVLSQLTTLALIAFVSAALYSVLGILKRHSNDRVAYVGNLFSKIESPVVTSIIVALIMTYVLLVRQSLESLGSFGQAVIEWAALSGIVLFIFIKLQSAMLDDSAQRPKSHKWPVAYSDKAELEKATFEVDSFINEGKKEGLVMLMATALIDNGVSSDTSRSILSIIIDHEDDKDPPAMFKWAVGNINEANRKKRLDAVNNMTAAMISAIDTTGDAVKKHNGPDMVRQRV